MAEESLPYFSYLLRLWQVESKETSLWRFSLENARTGERHFFASVTTMLAFLEAKMNSQLDLSEDNGRSRDTPDLYQGKE